MSVVVASGDATEISRAHLPAETDFVHAARLLGQYVATQTDEDRGALEDVLQGWPTEAFRKWLRMLHSSHELRAAQVSGHGWAPGGRMWQAAAPMRAKLAADVARRNTVTTPADRHRAFLRREAEDLAEEGADLAGVLRVLDAWNADAERGAKLSRREVFWIARRALEAEEVHHGI